MADWDERWRQGDTPWEKGYAAPPLAEYLEAGATTATELHRARRVLVPGCGSGHDVRLLSRHGIPATGLDLSPAAVERARQEPPAGGEDYVCGDLFSADWRAGREFDAVWEHTCFCAIDPSMRPAYVRAMAEILPPGGHLVGVFFLTPWDPGEREAGPPFGTSREEIVALFAPWFELRGGRLPERAYPGREGREWLAVLERCANPGVAESGLIA
ncbi:TPMT family class I SAM-dependent methyltransferase [Luteolibacter flavescens]|uniref:TPMT family class I SAM-dependent methyltransferase n=1 Tax=Luteolibacter flavescens TaxID=1859460 RepID=A0ABT3FV62_9BACT|nr:TPMT family class I SAM-dependent methyltransferase [Luteolibacter flavescens]MCW1887189.1 TPMT family class I SAM-dependent methyltransferase [Luteolibacter flavescens]